MSLSLGVLVIAALTALVILALGYHWIALHNHNRGHICVYDTLEALDPELLSLVLIVMVRGRALKIPNLDEVVAILLYRHDLHRHRSILDDEHLDAYLKSCVDKHGRKAANRITERTKPGEWR